MSFENEISWCAAAQRLKQSHCVATNADHSRFRSFAEQLNLAAMAQTLNVTPFQPRYFADATTQQITALNQHIVTTRFEVADRRPCNHRQQCCQVFFADGFGEMIFNRNTELSEDPTLLRNLCGPHNNPWEEWYPPKSLLSLEYSFSCSVSAGWSVVNGACGLG